MAGITTSAGAAIPVQTLPVLNPSSATGALNDVNITCEVESGGFPVSNTLCNPSPTAITNLAPGKTFNLQLQIATKGNTTVQLGVPPLMRRLLGLQALGLVLPAVVFLPLSLAGERRRKLLSRRAAVWLGLAVLMAALLMSMSCGGNGFANPNNSLQPTTGASSATPVGSYVVQITGTNQQTGQTEAIGSIPLTVGF
jgi:hypothetical protein